MTKKTPIGFSPSFQPAAQDNLVRLHRLCRTDAPVSVERLYEKAQANYKKEKGRNAPTAVRKKLTGLIAFCTSNQLVSALERCNPAALARENSLKGIDVAETELRQYAKEYYSYLRAGKLRSTKSYLELNSVYARWERRQGEHYHKSRVRGFGTLLTGLESALETRLSVCKRRREQLQRRQKQVELKAGLNDCILLEDLFGEIRASIPEGFPLSELPVCSRSGTPYAYWRKLQTTGYSPQSVVTWGQLERYYHELRSSWTSEARRLPKAFRFCFLTEQSGDARLVVPRAELARRIVKYLASIPARRRQPSST